jgi:hypothetical protein
MNDMVLTSYHFSVVKVLSTKRAVFYPRPLWLSREKRQKHRCSSNIGSPDCKTCCLVSLAGTVSSIVSGLSQMTKPGVENV